jgi:proline iminopeptidase
MKSFLTLAAILLMLAATPLASADATAKYFDNTGRSDVLSGGVRMIPITTPTGTFKVWTKRVGNNPTGGLIKFLKAVDSGSFK